MYVQHVKLCTSVSYCSIIIIPGMWFVHHNLESSFLSLLPNPPFCQTLLPFRGKPGVSFSS